MSEDEPLPQSASAEFLRRKLLDTVQQTRAKERAWQQVEELLRRLIVRLSVLAAGESPAVDAELEAVRSAIRDRADHQRLQRRLNALAEALKQLDYAGGARKRRAARRPAEVLATLLEHVELPAALSDACAGLIEKLHGSERDSDPDPLVAECAALLGAAMSARGGSSGTSQKAPGWRRWLGGGGEEAPVATAREVLVQLLDRLHLPEDLAQRREALDAAACGSSDWQTLLEQTAVLVGEALERAQIRAARAGELPAATHAPTAGARSAPAADRRGAPAVVGGGARTRCQRAAGSPGYGDQHWRGHRPGADEGEWCARAWKW